MKEYGVNELRRMFLDFFESKDHLKMKSFSLVPHNDKSLLLINSGMAPLKPYFTGAEIPPKRRVTTCQKCIRTGDIENVGKTAPFTVMESLQYGTPVIGASIGGVPELIRDGENGLLYESGNEQQLCSRIETLWKDKTRLAALEKGCEETRFDTVETYCEKLLTYYNG